MLTDPNDAAIAKLSYRWPRYESGSIAEGVKTSATQVPRIE
jgi:hypothetical protein